MFQAEQYAHWHQFFENIPISSLDFYNSLECELKNRKVPETASARIEMLEGGMLSAKRIYLQVQRDWQTYHICVAPFGTGFFVSSRLLVWPWKTWPIIAGIGGAMLALLFTLFVGLTAESNSLLLGFLGIVACGFPLIFLFAVAAIVWFISCRRLTYYRLDTMQAFQEAVHRILVAQINRTVEASGRKPLTDAESKPILHKLLQR